MATCSQNMCGIWVRSFQNVMPPDTTSWYSQLIINQLKPDSQLQLQILLKAKATVV